MRLGLTTAKRWLTALRIRLLPTCREMSRHSSHTLDAPMPRLDQIGFRLHLLICRFCRRYRMQLVWLRRAALRSSAQPQPPRQLTESGRTRLKQALWAHPQS
jgi:hypothetical protein